MKKQFLYWLAFVFVLVVSCQKERSFEGSNNPSDGSLQADATGDCLPKTVNGAYLANTALVPATNTITVAVTVNQTGSYVIATDTVNGYHFRTSGVFTSTGVTNVTLRGNGTPFSAGVNNFVVNYDSTVCDIAVTVLPAGTGSAVFTLAGAPNACTGATVQGTYATGVALTPANTVVLTTNVTTIGTYTISTTYQGMTFAATGAFTTTGLNTVTLTGTGTPTTGGANTVPITVGTSTCNFPVNVTAPSAGTLTCGTLAVQGTYTANSAVTSSNTIQVPVTFTTAGPYTISSNSVDGLSFTTTGTAMVGTQTITVPAAGTPTTAGVKNFTLSLNGNSTGTCAFSVPVLPATGGTAAGTLNCPSITVQGTYTAGGTVTAANTIQVQVNFTSTGSYNINSTSVEGLTFAVAGNATATGPATITVPAVGNIPAVAGVKNFTLSLNGSSTGTCAFSVTVVPATGGAATGTLAGAPNACAPITVNGFYYSGTAVGAGNTVQVQLNVSTAGTYNITTNTVGGISFAGSGTVATGNQTVTLTATGNPSTTGPQTYTVTFGTSTCTFIVNLLSSDYFPRTNGSNWSYEDDNDANDSLYRYVKPPTVTILGNTYDVFFANDGSGPDSSGYYRKSGNDYFEWFDVGSVGFDPPPIWIEYIMLKENAAVGTTWNSNGFTGNISGTPYTLRFKYSIAPGTTVAVTSSTGTVTYQNVIVVKEEFEQFVGGIWVSATSAVGYGMSYYAKGIGLVKYEAFDGAGVSQYVREVRRWVVY